MIRSLPLIIVLLLAACGTDDARYVLATPAPAAKARVAIATLEVRDVTLPAYAAASEIVVEEDDGALHRVKNAVWADDPVHGVTGALARLLDEATTAAVAAEPWPLQDPAQARLEVRIDDMIARADGRFEMTGQFALTSPDGVIRDRLQRFDITAPLPDRAPGSVAKAAGTALSDLAGQIVQRLRR
ncbi:MAG: hypothetical protein GC146_08815 [Limimaricola sp.]|uniref:PqiC family protein n=1 Tax=Limimaricola sp. TaxID=2211665 RepID=UPI001DEDB62C|nr:PqiC family protein [Limimaricola sp.]MBI1417309.1 hypothetical protein [Limimaricola sp.]